MFGINGDYGKKSQIGLGFGTDKVNQTQKTESTSVIDNKAKGEYRDKLLNQVQPQFVRNTKIDKADAEQLQEMFAMVNVPTKYIPTKASYDRIAENTVAVAKQFDEIGTKANVEHLYTTETFQKLNNLFGIE